jgi:hypothetical protein
VSWDRNVQLDIDAFLSQSKPYFDITTKTSDYVAKNDVELLIVHVNLLWKWDTSAGALLKPSVPMFPYNEFIRPDGFEYLFFNQHPYQTPRKRPGNLFLDAPPDSPLYDDDHVFEAPLRPVKRKLNMSNDAPDATTPI